MQDTAGTNSTKEVTSDRASDARSAAIRNLNDRLRVYGAGGMVVMTDGIASHDLATVNRIFVAVAEFDRFDKDNDPYGEHDCGSLEFKGVRIIWKTDYYDQTREFGSADPTDPTVTTRVLTVMLAEEY